MAILFTDHFGDQLRGADVGGTGEGGGARVGAAAGGSGERVVVGVF